jgi:eukaryotic-like serine/threonine-protein kinase
MEMFGRYRIDAHVGEGAMADVYRAHDTGIERVVAIKVLKPDLRRDPEVARRFLRESKAAGNLSHANIATIYDVGEADGVPYIAMEYVEGRPLDEVLKEQGRLPCDRVLAIGAQLAAALAYAHRQGVVHRDVKPSNILLADKGQTPKLLDFGIARMVEADAETDAAEKHAVATQVGQVIGTPRYMSPEQALGLPVDQRSDLFSLGVVLYEMVTGKPAFSGAGLATLAIQIAQEQPSAIDGMIRDCPKGLRFIVEKLLAKKPEQRFADGEALRAALMRELDAQKIEEPVKRRGLALRIKLPLILVSATALALAVSVQGTLSRERATLEHMVLTSGASITGFVTSNAALLAADNAGLPAQQQDWAPLQAFVDNAARDSDVRRLVVVGDQGFVRAASDHGLIGTRYAAPEGEKRVAFNSGDISATETREGFRFVRPIKYAGANFGKVDLVLDRGELNAASNGARDLLLGLAVLVMCVVSVMSYMSGRMISTPVQRLRRALDDAAKGGLSFRISHSRGDEFGALFDSFNTMAQALEPQLLDPAELAAREQAMQRTRVGPASTAPKPRKAA